MEVSSTVATWLSLAATILGLGSIATQFGTIIDQTDPFHSLRDLRHLGSWWRRQPKVPWYQIIKPPPVGPVINANLLNGICGKKRVHLSRLPLTPSTGQAAWSILLSVVHPITQKDSRPSKHLIEGVSVPGEKEGEHIVTITDKLEFDLSLSPSEIWDDISLCPLVRHRLTTCTLISRGTLLTLLCLTNARQIFRYSSASGHRAAYASYCGQWRIEWPIGDRACVFFCAHDSHVYSKDVYPATFEQRVDKCLQMLAGVIDSEIPNGFKCAFPGRKSAGKWRLEYAPKGFGGAHSGRHLYNMIGGKVNEVDFLFMRPANMENELESLGSTIVLRLPNKEDGASDVVLYIGTQESAVLDEALDCLPWSFLSWSVHRGLRDILTAYSKQRMDHYRNRLANTLRLAVLNRPETLIARGWDPLFVKNEMADMASSAVLAGRGNSGDAVRVVTDIAASFWGGEAPTLDETHFWRQPASEESVLSPMTVIALVKCFVLEWSNELDYQMYHDFPVEMYLG